MKRSIMCCSALLIASAAFAQKEATTWYFGNQGEGLEFRKGCDPNVLTDGAIAGFEGVATISDETTGELLFYTNSQNVWDRTHQLMPNGGLITMGWTITQVLPIRKPGSTSQYYIFTSEVQGSGVHGIQFHCVDMTLNNGLGDVAYDSLALNGPVSEKLTAIRHSNGTDLWVIAHGYGNDQFYAFLVTSSGVQTAPVVSAIGKVHGDPSTVDALGELKANPQGDRLAVATTFQPHIELFDFDRSSGVVDNLRTLDAVGGYDGLNASGWYGVSFSQDGSKLYAASGFVLNQGIIQFDLTVDDVNVINASKYVVSSGLHGCYSLKLAPNGRIYVGRRLNFLGEIAYPDSAGSACGFDPEAVVFAQLGSYSTWGLNNLMELEEYPCMGTDVGEHDRVKGNALVLGPNPASHDLNVFLGSEGLSWRIRIISELGTEVLTASGAGSKVILDVHDLAPGVYAVIAEQDKRIRSCRFVKE